MAYKDREKQKEYQRKWVAQRVEQLRPQRTAVRKRNAEYVRNIKESNPCTDCKAYYPYYVMQFDHLGVETKLKAVGSMATENYSLAKIQAEIDKCELVCANCHAFRTHTRRGDRVA